MLEAQKTHGLGRGFFALLRNVSLITTVFLLSKTTKPHTSARGLGGVGLYKRSKE
jgi:hypothetical protein